MNSADKVPAAKLPRSASRLRRYAAAAGSLVLASTLALSGLVSSGGVEQTEAAWTDTEQAQAAITANWMQGFTRVTNPGWKMQRVSQNEANYSTYGLTGPSEVNRDFGLSYPQVAGYSLAEGEDWASRSLGGTSPNTGSVPTRNPSDDLWMGQYVEPGLFEYEIASASFCMSYPQPTQIPGATSACFADPTSPPRMIAHQNTNGYTFSIESSTTKIARINASGFSSTAQCFADGSSSASIRDVGAILNLANETTAGNGGYDNSESITDYIPESDSSNERWDGTTDKWARYNVNASNSPRYVLLVNIRKNTYEKAYYALAEMDLVVQVYSSGAAWLTPGRFIGQINLPLTRSECGFSDGTAPIPPMAGLWRDDPNQLPWPDPWINPPATVPDNSNGRLQEVTHDPIPGSFTPTDQEALAAQKRESLATSLLPSTTVTSPAEHTTATSEPPTPAEEDESTVAGTSGTTSTTSPSTNSTKTTSVTTTDVPSVPSRPSKADPPATRTPTSTSAPPAVVIPTEPANLPATARTAEVGTVELDGEELDVVVRGATVPADARAGARVLGAWTNDDSARTEDWKTFTSEDPDEDGWRWAAINQKTGTVVYIR